MNVIETMANLWKSTGIAHSIAYGEWQNYVMILVSFVLFYLAIVKQFEPLLLLPISFGMFIINIPGANDVLFGTGHGASADKLAEMAAQGKEATYGLFHYLEFGVSKVIYRKPEKPSYRRGCSAWRVHRFRRRDPSRF